MMNNVEQNQNKNQNNTQDILAIARKLYAVKTVAPVSKKELETYKIVKDGVSNPKTEEIRVRKAQIVTTPIEDDNLTYGQLMTMLPSTKGMKLPGRKQLEKMNLPVILEAETVEGHVIVYGNGIYVFEIDEDRTIFTVDRCCPLKWHFVDGEESEVPEEVVKDMHWADVLVLAVLPKIEYNRCRRARRKEVVNFDTMDHERNMQLSVPFDEEEFIEREDNENRWWEQRKVMLLASLERLTERQKKMLVMSRVEKMTEAQIADRLCVRQQSVSDVLRAANKKLERIFS